MILTTVCIGRFRAIDPEAFKRLGLPVDIGQDSANRIRNTLLHCNVPFVVISSEGVKVPGAS